MADPGANGKKHQPVQKKPLEWGTPFFIAVASDVKTARQMMKTGDVTPGGFLAADHVTYIWSGGDDPRGDVTRVFVQGGSKEKYVPLPRDELIRLYEMHGYKFAGPVQYKRILEMRSARGKKGQKQ